MMTKNKMRGAAGFRAAACALMISAVSVFSAVPAGMLTSYAAPNFQLDTAMNGAGPGTAAAVSSNANVPKYEPRAVSSKVGGYYFNGTGMYTYDQLTADLNSLKSISGFDCGSMGQSPDGRELWHAVIGNPSASRKILVIATMHGREYMVTPVVMRQMKDLLDRRNAGDQMLQDVCFHVLPMINPDGVAISQYGVDGMKTQKMKNTVNNILQSWSSWGIFDDANKYIWYLNKWKNTATGVDLNRNFATNGWTGLNDLRAKASNDLYKGPFVESEPETRAMVQMIQSTQFDEVLSYHMQGQVLYWYAPTGSEAVNNRSREIAEVVKASSGYALVPAENNGTGVGSLKTWLSEMKGIPCVTIEAGIGTCPLPESDFEGVWQRNKDVLYEAALELTVGHEAYAEMKGWNAAAQAETAAAGTVTGDDAADAQGAAADASQGAAAAPAEATVQAAPAETAAQSVVAAPAETAAQGVAPAETAAQGVAPAETAAQGVAPAETAAQGVVQSSGAAGSTAGAGGSSDGVLFVEAFPGN